jgi:hypothetical protein
MSEGQRMAAQIVEIGQKRGEIDQRLKKEEVALLLHQAFTGASCSGMIAPSFLQTMRGSAKYKYRQQLPRYPMPLPIKVYCRLAVTQAAAARAC